MSGRATHGMVAFVLAVTWVWKCFLFRGNNGFKRAKHEAVPVKKKPPFVVDWMVNMYNGKGDGYRAEKSLTRQEKNKKGREENG